MTPGLVSITFRKLEPAGVIALCRENGLATIEWGGDVHVPHGDAARAAEVGALTRAAGLEVAAYGSYYRLAVSEGEGLAFDDVLASAVALGAPSIRVWAGNRNPEDADENFRAAVAADALRCADLAGRSGITVAYEFHGNTLTSTTESTCRLLEATAHPFIKTLWQPPVGLSTEDCLAGLRLIMPHLLHVHAFHWWPDAGTRLPLADGRDRWSRYFDEVRREKPGTAALLEFVRGDDPAQLAADAACLRQLLSPES